MIYFFENLIIYYVIITDYLLRSYLTRGQLAYSHNNRIIWRENMPGQYGGTIVASVNASRAG